MEIFIQNLLIALFLPIFAIILILIPSNFVSIPKRRITLGTSLFASVTGLIISLYGAAYIINNQPVSFDFSFVTLNAGLLKIHAGVFLDNLSVFFLTVIYLALVCTEIFSYRFLKNEEGFDRYFILINLLAFGALNVVLSTNLIQAAAALTLLGFISAMFSAFRYKRPEAKIPCYRAHLTALAGDFLIWGAVLALLYFNLQMGSNLSYPLLTFEEVNSWAFSAFVQMGSLAYTGLCLCVVFGVFAKSAQIPFQNFLQDVSDAPMPACGLICAAFTASMAPYLLMRTYQLLILAPLTLKILMVMGTLTAIIMALTAFCQNDIKKILISGAASTLGVVFASLGAGAYSGAVFQLGTFILAQTLLFLTAGIITNRTLTRNVKFLGGLREYMPTAALAFIIGALSLSGIFLSGFYSKEMILCHIVDTNQTTLLWSLAIAEILTVIWLARAYFLVFEGHYRGAADFSNSLEKPFDGISGFMAVPVYFLGIITIVAGGFIAPDFQRFIYVLRQKFYLVKHPEITVVIFILSLILIYAFFLVFGARKVKLNRLRRIYPALNWFIEKVSRPIINFFKKLLISGLYFNKLYGFIYKYCFEVLAKAVLAVDKYVINGFSFAFGQLTRFTGYLTLKIQDGKINSSVFLAFAFLSLMLICVVTVYIKGLSQYGG